MPSLLVRVWERWFGEAVRKVEAESAAYRNSPEGRAPDWKTAAVLLTAAASLTAQNYLQSYDLLFGPAPTPLAALTWWAVVVVLTYTVPPLLLIRYGFRERLADYGVKARGAFAGWPLYLAFVAVMAPLVAAFSAGPGFRQTYPFLPVSAADGLSAGLVRWELLYALQFVALEFFFRGFLVHGTRHRFGVYSVFVMTVPYCMIHFGKPAPECTASIVAGVALGLTSLTTRSIWLGAALHVSVAWGMDFACLWRQGVFGG